MTIEELDEWERRLALYKIPATLDWFLPRLIAAYREALRQRDEAERILLALYDEVEMPDGWRERLAAIRKRHAK